MTFRAPPRCEAGTRRRVAPAEAAPSQVGRGRKIPMKGVAGTLAQAHRVRPRSRCGLELTGQSGDEVPSVFARARDLPEGRCQESPRSRLRREPRSGAPALQPTPSMASNVGLAECARRRSRHRRAHRPEESDGEGGPTRGAGHSGLQWLTCPAATRTKRSTSPPASTRIGASGVCWILWRTAAI